MFDSVKDCIAAISRGEIVILVDASDRENEGDFVLAGSKSTKEKLNFMLTHGRGILCVSVSKEKAEKLSLQKMTLNNDKFETPFTVSVDAKTAHTGVSVEDRLKTILLLSGASAKPSDFVRPGHVFPLESKPWGVLERQGHTEGSLELVKRATKKEDSAVIIEIMRNDGSMARMPELFAIKKKFGLKMISIQQLVDFRLLHENILEKKASPVLPTEFGEFRIFGFRDKVFGKEHVALVKGNVKGKTNVLTRIHSACFTGDVLSSQKCDCREQLVESQKRIHEKGGVIVYGLDHEGRGIGLVNKLRAYELQEKGLDTVEANKALGFKVDQRDYSMSAQVLRALGVKSINLLTNNPDKVNELERFGVKVIGCTQLKIAENKFNRAYLATKKTKLAHFL